MAACGRGCVIRVDQPLPLWMAVGIDTEGSEGTEIGKILYMGITARNEARSAPLMNFDSITLKDGLRQLVVEECGLQQHGIDRWCKAAKE